jgi:hypothetical protein
LKFTTIKYQHDKLANPSRSLDVQCLTERRRQLALRCRTNEWIETG